jgi:hypothetical protein
MSQTFQLTKDEVANLTAEMQHILLSIFEKETFKIKRFHSDAEQERLQEIAKILKAYEMSKHP